MRWLGAAGVMAVLLPALPAAAETVPVGGDIAAAPGIRAYLASPPYMAMVHALAKETDANLKVSCAGEGRVTPVAYYVMQALVLEPRDAHPSAGFWTMRYSYERCGRTAQYRAYFGGQPGGGEPRRAAGMPGLTTADPVLGRDVLPAIGAAMAGAPNAPRDCRDMKIADTTIVRPWQADESIAPGATSTEEVWTVRACGVDVPIAVTFFQRPGIPGTSYAAKAAGRRPAP